MATTLFTAGLGLVLLLFAPSLFCVMVGSWAIFAVASWVAERAA